MCVCTLNVWDSSLGWIKYLPTYLTPVPVLASTLFSNVHGALQRLGVRRSLLFKKKLTSCSSFEVFFAPTEIAPARLVFAEACCESESFLIRAGTRAPKHSSDTERPYSRLAKQTANLWATNLLVMRVGCCRTRSSSRPSQSSSRLRAMSASWLMTPNTSSRLRNMENSLCRCRVLTRMASVIRPVETRSSRVISGQGITNLTGGGERREETRLESEK